MQKVDIYQNAVQLLKELIATASFSREEEGTAVIIRQFLVDHHVKVKRLANNIFAFNKYFNPALPSIILNSHHDTVPPNSSYTKDPFNPEISEGNIYGLGSTDAGASLVSLILCFLHFHERENLKYNLVIAATAEEEISGENGISLLIRDPEFRQCLQKGSFAIIGEPTGLELAVAEKGLLVLDCTVNGKPGHAARDEGDNAIYKAMKAIAWFQSYHFDKVSDLLGPVKMTVTSIDSSNKSHNIVPSSCSFIVDIRINELYTHEEILERVKEEVDGSLSILYPVSGILHSEHIEIKPRSLRLRSTMIPEAHPVVQAGKALGKRIYGSPTLSDKSLIGIPALKCGPGHSAQSHSANEYIKLDDIYNGIDFYCALIDHLNSDSSN